MRDNARTAVVSTAAASAAIMACGVVTGLIAARSLGADGRGQLATITVWSLAILYVGDLGLPDAVAYTSAAERPRRERVWTTAQTLAITVGLLVTAAGWWLFPWVLRGPNAPLVDGARWYLALFAIPSLGASLALAWLHGLGRMRAFNVSRPIVQLVTAIGMAALFLAGDDSVLHFAAVIVVANWVTWVVAASFGPGRRIAAFPPSMELARKMLGYGRRILWGNWAVVANERLDQLVLSLTVSSTSLGLYVVAFNYSMLLHAITNTAVMAMWPGMVASHQDGGAAAYVARWYRFALWMVVPAAGVAAAATPMIIPLLFGAEFSGAVPLALLLVPAVVLHGMNSILATAFLGIGQPQVVSESQTIGLAVTVAALAALLPALGASGAAIASLLSYGSTHVFLLRKTVRTFSLDARSLTRPTLDDVDALWVLAFPKRQRGTAPSRGVNP